MKKWKKIFIYTFEMKRKLIQVIRAVSKKAAVDYRKVVDDALVKHDLLPKYFIFVTDNENTMATAFDSYEERNGCFAHMESKMFSEGFGLF